MPRPLLRTGTVRAPSDRGRPKDLGNSLEARLARVGNGCTATCYACEKIHKLALPRFSTAISVSLLRFGDIAARLCKRAPN